MADVKLSDVIGELEQYKYNPALIQRVALETLKKATDGAINIVDPTNPFVYCLENTATNTAVFMQQNEASTRRLYASAALDVEDLYLHMSDKDYIDRFAKPSTAKFTVLLAKDELLNKLVLDASTGIRKLTIPRNTVFRVADIPFSLQYPIDIRLLTHGGLQIVYVNDQVSPLQRLTTNIIDWEQVVDAAGVKYVKFTVEATQFSIETSYNDVSAASGFKTEIPLTDAFYYVRCYLQQSTGHYTELLTTHTQQLYDPATPTAVIKVLDNKVRVTIPVVYTTTGQVKGKLRIDVYQTKGALNMLLGNYKLEDFVAHWINIDPADDTVYTTPIRQFKTIALYSTSHVNGGRDALSFEALKARVIRNTVGQQSLPITNVQLQASLEDQGYTIVKNVDTITNRIFLATRALPNSSDEKILTAAASAMTTVSLSFKDALNGYGVIDNGSSLTLSAKTIYQNRNGITKPITQAAFEALNRLPLLQRCKEITEGNYFYSPFTYILDASTATFEVRPYYLEAPTIETKNFIAENPTTGLQVSIAAAYSIQKTETGYALKILTESSEAFRALEDDQIFVQLAFKSKNQTEKVCQLGELIGKDPDTGERLYRFELQSNFNIDRDDYLELASFESPTNGLVVKTQLLQEMDLFFTTTAPMTESWQRHAIDDQLGRFQLPDTVIGITHETLTLRLGYSLKNLWAMARSVLSSIPYQVYQTDVIATYPQDVYAIDPETGAHFSIDENGQLVYNLLHAKGEVMLDEAGNPRYAHLKGEIVYDAEGQPLPMAGYEREMLRIFDILMIEGVYYFATDAVVKTYRNIVTSALLSWITEDLVSFQQRLLEQTKLYFYPKITAGDIKVLTADNAQLTLPAGQSVKVKLYVPPATYNDEILKAALMKATIKAIDAALQHQTVSVSAMEASLRALYKTDVIDVEVSGLGGALNLNAFTVLDNTTRCSLRKRLTALPDNQLIVEEDISISFIKHGLEM